MISDSRIVERLEQWDANRLSSLNWQIAVQGIKEGFLHPIAIVDGTQLGKQLYSVLGIQTRWGDILLLDVEPLEKRGKELPGSECLIRRMSELGYSGMIKYLLVDALYLNERVYRWKEQGWIEHFVVKYTPDTVESAKGFRRMVNAFEKMVNLWEEHKGKPKALSLKHRMGFGEQRGRDERRGLRYRIYYARTNSCDRRYSMARVEEYRGGEKISLFYVFSTDKELDGLTLRELAHQRWYIENDGFRMLNAHIHSKRVWSKNRQVLQNLLLIQILAVGLLMLFRREYRLRIHKAYPNVKQTLGFVSSLLFEYCYIGAHWVDR